MSAPAQATQPAQTAQPVQAQNETPVDAASDPVLQRLKQLEARSRSVVAPPLCACRHVMSVGAGDQRYDAHLARGVHRRDQEEPRAHRVPQRRQAEGDAGAHPDGYRQVAQRPHSRLGGEQDAVPKWHRGLLHLSCPTVPLPKAVLRADSRCRAQDIAKKAETSAAWEIVCNASATHETNVRRIEVCHSFPKCYTPPLKSRRCPPLEQLTRFG